MNTDASHLSLTSLVRNTQERIVAVEPNPDGTATLFRRTTEDAVESFTLPFHPWLLVDDPALLPPQTAFQPLQGNGQCRLRAEFATLAEYDNAIKALKKTASATALATSFRQFTDLTQQFLTQASVRLFGNMTFPELRRLQLDIETRAAGEPHFPDAKRPDDLIMMVSLKDSTGWEKCLVLQNEDEPALLRELVAIIQERDPDVIEGHNIFNFDLPYIVTRCKRHKILFAIGRDGSQPETRASRITVSERIIPYTRFDIYGRHVVDTLHLVLFYDAIHRDMDSHTLKYSAKYFGVASPDRTYLPGDKLTQLFESDPDKVIDYCLDDARETDALSRILSPSYFYQATMIPYSYQNCITRGSASKVDAMLCAEYMLANHSLPTPDAQREYQGALTEGNKSGVFQNVWHADVRSLYPSIIISRQMSPAQDQLGVFLRLLTQFREFRLAAKDARKTATPERRNELDALQSSFKILINSFYGYTGFSQGTFNDYAMAAAITATGREILSSMKQFLETSGANVIEMDTDGIYFVPPPGVTDSDAFEAEIQAQLPKGIEIELDAKYAAMFGYKSKNYALLSFDGKISMTGAALKSRGTEPFIRRYIKEFVRLLLTGKEAELPALLEKYTADITAHALPIADFAKREYLSSDPKVYAKKLETKAAKHSAAFDLALASGKTYRQGDAVDYYVTGTKKTVSVTENSRLLADALPDVRDENTAYYLAKLEQTHKKLMSGD